jgi:hypothetical protein
MQGGYHEQPGGPGQFIDALGPEPDNFISRMAYHIASKSVNHVDFGRVLEWQKGRR